MGDGGDDFGIGGGGIQHNEGVVGFIQIAFVDGFGYSGKITVGIESSGFAHKNG